MTIDLYAHMKSVPEFTSFLGVDALNHSLAELASKHPDLARLRRVGTSRLGEPISMLSIGSGGRNALMFATAHPDEPIGALTISHLARVLCEDADLREAGDYTWHFIPCTNPDDMRLNEGWFEPPFSIGRFASLVFRPAMHNDLEWSFPFQYEKAYFDRTMSETHMLMRVIDELRPAVMGSLHNNVFGGVYYYLESADPYMQRVLPEIAASEGLLLRLGEPETPYVEELGPGVMRLPRPQDQYEYELQANPDLEELSLPGSSLSYAEQYGTRSIVVEMSYFDDARVADQTEIEQSVREVISESRALAHEGLEFLEPIFAEVVAQSKANSVFAESLRANLQVERAIHETKRTWAENTPDTLRKATVADLFANRQEVKIRRLINAGTMLRLLDAEITAGHGTPLVRTQRTRVESQFLEWEREIEAELDVRVVPIRKLVAVQLGAILARAFGDPNGTD